MIINPNCDMPWNIYLDYLADQGFDELREIDVFSLVTCRISFPYHNHSSNCRSGIGNGELREGAGFSMVMADSFGSPFYSWMMSGAGGSWEEGDYTNKEGCGM